jgi:hypothetical protein
MLTLRLPSNWAKKLYGELRAAGSKEIGGIMMGEHLAPNEFQIVELTFQRKGGKFSYFVRNAKIALTALQNFFRRTGHSYKRFNYLGEWHSHPSFSTQPSIQDHETMIDVACHQNTGANFVLLMIVRLLDDGSIKGNVTVYLPSGQFELGELKIADECSVEQ